MASKAFLNSMGILGLIQVQLELIRKEFPDDETLGALLDQANKSIMAVGKSWPGVCDERDWRRLRKWMEQFNEHFHMVEIRTLFSTGLALVEDLASHIKNPDRSRMLEVVQADLYAVHEYFDDALDAHDEYVEAALAVDAWHEVREDIL